MTHRLQGILSQEITVGFLSAGGEVVHWKFVDQGLWLMSRLGVHICVAD